MNYRPLYSFRVEHDYFEKGICHAIHCRISPAEVALWNRDRLLFRQIGANEWVILYDSESADVDISSDILVLEMYIIDPAFMLYTHWDGFHPNVTYGLELPLKKETVDVTKTICEISPKRSVGSSLCQIRIHMTDKLVEMARAEKPMTCTLRFHAPAYQWEYLLIPRNTDNVLTEKYLMEETSGKLHFSPFKPAWIYGRNILRTVSEEAVPIHERYEYRLRVVSPTDNTGLNRTVLKHISPPEPGRFIGTEPGVLRQICYL